MFASLKADLSISLNRADREKIMTGERKLTDMLTDGTAQSEGNVDVVAQLASTLDQFDLGFELMPSTGAQDLTPPLVYFQQVNLNQLLSAAKFVGADTFEIQWLDQGTPHRAGHKNIRISASVAQNSSSFFKTLRHVH